MTFRAVVLVSVTFIGVVATGCRGDDNGEASQGVKDCVAGRQAAAADMGLPADGIAALLEECEAAAKLGFPADTPEASPNEVPPDISACDGDRRVLEVALETYYANGGSAQVDESRLVQAELLRGDLPGFSILEGSVVADAGGPCD